MINSKINNDFMTTFILAHELGEYGLILPLDNRWSKPHGLESDIITIMVSESTKKDIHYDNTGLTISVLLGEDENPKESRATFKWSEIIAILDSNWDMLMGRDYPATKIEPISIYDLMYD